MKRLTIRNSDGSVSQPTHSTFEKVFNRLADYEDIGLEPQEIMAAIQIKHGHVYQYPTVFGKDFEDVKKLIDAEEQGLLVRLPCKLGSTVYDITEFVERTPHAEMYEFHADYIGIGKSYDGRTVISIDCMDYYMDDFGKTVFLTREEAEKALEEVCRKNT